MQLYDPPQEHILVDLLQLRKDYLVLEAKLSKLEEDLEMMEDLKHQFDQIFNTSTEGILIIQDHIIKVANPGFMKLVRSQDSYVGLELDNFKRDVGENQSAIEAYEKIMAGEALSFYKGHETLRSIEGHEIPVEVHGGLTQYDGKPAFLVLFHDLTLIHNAEETLDKLTQIQTSMVNDEYVWLDVTDHNGNVVIWNHAAENTSGYSKEEVVGKNQIWQLMYPDEEYLGEISNDAMRAIIRNQSLTDYETTIRTKDGKLRNMIWNCNSIRDSEKRHIGLITIGRDITARKQAENEFLQSLNRIRAMLNNTIDAMGKIVESRDSYTAGHQHRVSILSTAIAKELDLSIEQIECLRMSALVHDIGKISVPAEILTKPSRLSDAEFSIIKTHPSVGYEVFKDFDYEWPIAQIVLQHHERIDGTGYPNGLSADEILIEAKILSVADVVEAMSTHRPYRPALGIEKAIEEIKKGRGKIFDSHVVDACIKVVTQENFSFG